MMENYMLDPVVRQYYDRWMESPTCFGYPYDAQRFYQFVKACVDWAEKNGFGKNLDIDFFKDVLIDEVRRMGRHQGLHPGQIQDIIELREYPIP